jgi:hypothetical protein
MSNRKKNKKAKRGQNGRFLPGNREGPGRPKGSRNKTTKAGSGTALQLVFDRLAPARKERCVQVRLPPIRTLEDLLSAQSNVIAHAAAGSLTPGEAHTMAALLDLRRRTIESTEIETRLAALEARMATGVSQ